MLIKKVAAKFVLEKRTTRLDSVSMAFEELCACLKGQYTSMRVSRPDGSVQLVDGADFSRALAGAHPVTGRDNAGRTMRGNMSGYYVVKVTA